MQFAVDGAHGVTTPQIGFSIVTKTENSPKATRQRRRDAVDSTTSESAVVSTAEQPNSDILKAITAGRAGRGANAPDAWITLRARALTLASEGLKRQRIADALRLRLSDTQEILAEACDAVLRSGAEIEAADGVCVKKWERWCLHRNDPNACLRAQHIPARPSRSG